MAKVKINKCKGCPYESNMFCPADVTMCIKDMEPTEPTKEGK